MIRKDYYYQVHVAGGSMGLWAHFRARKAVTEKEIIKEAVREQAILKDDIPFVDIAVRLSRDEYLSVKLGLVAAEKYKVLHTRKANLPLLIGSLKYQQSKDLLERRMKT